MLNFAQCCSSPDSNSRKATAPALGKACSRRGIDLRGCLAWGYSSFSMSKEAKMSSKIELLGGTILMPASLMNGEAFMRAALPAMGSLEA